MRARMFNRHNPDRIFDRDNGFGPSAAAKSMNYQRRLRELIGRGQGHSRSSIKRWRCAAEEMNEIMISSGQKYCCQSLSTAECLMICGMKNVEFKTRGAYHHHYFSSSSLARNGAATRTFVTAHQVAICRSAQFPGKAHIAGDSAHRARLGRSQPLRFQLRPGA